MKLWLSIVALALSLPSKAGWADRLTDFNHRVDRQTFIERLHISLAEVAAESGYELKECSTSLETAESNYAIITSAFAGLVFVSAGVGAVATLAGGGLVIGLVAGSGIAAGLGGAGAVLYGLEEPEEVATVAVLSSTMASVGSLGAAGGVAVGLGAVGRTAGTFAGVSGAFGSNHFHRLVGRCEENEGSLCDAFYMPINSHYRIELRYEVARRGESDYTEGTCMVFFTVDQQGRNLHFDYEIDRCSPHGDEIFPERKEGFIRVGAEIDWLDGWMGQGLVVARGNHDEVLMDVNGLSYDDYRRLLGGEEEGDFGFLKEFVWPVPSSMDYTSIFGEPRGGRIHEGIDIAAISGSEIVAAAEGVVVFSGNRGDGYGNMVIISHPQLGLRTLYAHNSANYVRNGQKVEEREPIAEVGSTGDSNGSHLHFEVIRDGNLWIRSILWISRVCIEMSAHPTALLSCGKGHCLALLSRLSQQVGEGFAKGIDRREQADYLEACVRVLIDHEVPGVRKLAALLEETLPVDSRSLKKWPEIFSRVLGDEEEPGAFGVTRTDRVTNKGAGGRASVSLVLDNLRSAFNVGCLLRSVEALGAGKVYVCGHSPDPENPKTAKSALGSERWVDWEYFPNTLDCLEELRRQGRTLYALETSICAADINTFAPRFPCALVLGNERFGLGYPVLARVDRILAFPLYGRKNSLNVAVCGSMALGVLMRES